MRNFFVLTAIFTTLFATIRATSFFGKKEEWKHINLLFAGQALQDSIPDLAARNIAGFSTPSTWSGHSRYVNRHYAAEGVDKSDRVIVVKKGERLKFLLRQPLRHMLDLAVLHRENVPLHLNGKPVTALVSDSDSNEIVLGPFQNDNLLQKLTLVPLEKNEPVNVVFIVLDAYRADNLGRGITPAIDALLRDSVYFEKHYVNSSWTRPSTMIFFTGLYASRHIINFWDYPVAGNEKRKFYKSGITPLPVIFGKNGYHTAMIGNNPFLTDRRYLGVDSGFVSVMDFSLLEKDTERITHQAIDYIRKQKNPFFLFLNYNDPHAPYTPPAYFYNKIKNKVPAAYPEKRKNYLAEAAFTDNEVGKFLAELKKRGLYDKSLVILTSDHGEVMDPAHGHSVFTGIRTLYGHGQGLYKEDIHTPLAIKFPENKHSGKRFSVLTRSIDIFPTILQELEFTPVQTDGKSLQSVVAGKESRDRDYYGESRGVVAVIKDHFKLQRKTWIFHRPGISWDGFVGQEQDYIYDLSQDPGEKTPVKQSAENLGIDKKLQEFMPARETYAIRLNNPGSIKNHFHIAVSIPTGKAVLKKGLAENTDGKRLVISKNLQPGEVYELEFEVIPDVSLPIVEGKIGSQKIGKGTLGVGEFDIYPNGCREACSDLFLARNSKPFLAEKPRVQFWKNGDFLAREDVVLEKGAMDILRKQGYVQ